MLPVPVRYTSAQRSEPGVRSNRSLLVTAVRRRRSRGYTVLQPPARGELPSVNSRIFSELAKQALYTAPE